MDIIIKNNDFGQNLHTSCDVWADIGECTKNPMYMLDKCPKSCEIKKKTKLFDSLFIERLNHCMALLETNNYNNSYASNYILNELIPYLRKINFNDLNFIYQFLKSNNVINQKLLDFAENDNNIEFTNSYIKTIYDTFKDIADTTSISIQNSLKKIIVKRCQKVNAKNDLRFSFEDQCINYIKTDTGLNKTIVDYCNTGDNMKNNYCTQLDNSIIQGRINKSLPVNSDLSTDMNNARINYTKKKLKDSKYVDDYSMNYINNEYKILIDNLNSNTNARNSKYLELVDKDAIKFCEDNYLEYENSTKTFCKKTFTTYKAVPDVSNSINKITEQNCLINNKFITDTECNKFANDNKNYIKFISPNNKYCSSNHNIVNDYCQNYYKNTENKINDLLIQDNCNNFSSFENKEKNNDTVLYNVELESFGNKEKDLILHNVELESFENMNTTSIFLIILGLIVIAVFGVLFYKKYIANKKTNNNNNNNNNNNSTINNSN
jgi:hypothetical protein